VKKVLYGVAGLVVLVVTAVLVVPVFVDANAFKGEIAAKVKEATGRELAIDGEIGVRFLVPATGITVEGVRFANLPGAAAPDMATLKELEVNVALLPLLRGEVQVESVRLVEPVIELEVLEDGRANWVMAAAGEAVEGEAEVTAETTAAGSIQIDDLVVSDATVTYRDARTGSFEVIENLDARLAAGSLQGPFTVAGAAVARNLPASFDLNVGRLAPGAPVPLKLALELADGAARIGLAGTLSQPSADGKLEGILQAKGSDLRALVSRLTAAIGSEVAAAPVPAESFQLDAAVTANAGEINLNDITLLLGETRATGAFSASLAEPLQIDATLTLNRLDLDALLAAAAPRGATADSEGDAPGASPATSVFVLPTDVAASFALNIDAVSYREAVIRQAQVTASLSEGRIELTKAAALLPGGSDVQLVGSLIAVDGKPQFDGGVEAASDNLRRLLVWLEVDVGPVSVDRLHKFSLTSRLRVTPELAQVFAIDLRLDTSRLTGAAAYAFRARPSFSADFVLDRINVDAYLPPQPTEPQKAEADAQAGDAGDGAKGFGDLTGQMAVLDQFDTNFKARVDSLIINEQQVSGLALDASLIGGVLTVRNVSVGNIAGASGAMSGVARDFAATPAFDVNVDARAADLGRLLRVGGITPSPQVATLGVASIKGGIRGSLADLDLDVAVGAAGGTVDLKGKLAQALTKPRFDFLLDARHTDLVKLANGFGAGLKKGQGADGPLRIKGKVAGDMDAMKLDLGVEAAGARVKVVGDLAGATSSPRFDLGLDLSHPSYIKLGGAFGLPLRVGAGAADGPFSVKGKVAGTLDAMDVNLSMAAAEINFKLAGNLAEATKAPRLDMGLDIYHPSLARLARTFDAGLQPAGNAEDGPLSVKGRVAGPLDLLQLDLSVAAAGASIKAAGNLAAATPEAMRYSLNIEAGHADVPGFARTIGIDYRPAAVNLGGLALRASLAGTAGGASLDNLNGTLGPVRIEGALKARWDGPRPAVTGSLSTSEIIVDLFLPVAPPQSAGTGTASPGQPGNQRWSRSTIDVTWLNAFDADLQLAARGIVFRGYDFREPKVTIRVAKGGLDIDPLTGRLFDGDVNLKAWVRQSSAPSVGLGLKISNGDVFKALTQAAQVDKVSGRFGFDGRFQTIGRSELEMVSGLTGQGSLSVRDGFVQGIDLRALSDRLGRLNSIVDFASLIDTTMTGGQTRLIQVAGTFKGARGVFSTNDLRTVLDGGEGTTVGTVDLPRWLINAETRFRLPDHPKAPPFGVDLRGSLDAPQRYLKTGQLQQYIAARVGGTVLRKTLGEDGAAGALGGVLGGVLGGGQPPPSQPQPAPQPAPQPSSPVDELIKGLGGILGGGN
jgi:uncharacterized protein involved in outer membrane biogenesis